MPRPPAICLSSGSSLASSPAARARRLRAVVGASVAGWCRSREVLPTSGPVVLIARRCLVATEVSGLPGSAGEAGTGDAGRVRRCAARRPRLTVGPRSSVARHHSSTARAAVINPDESVGALDADRGVRRPARWRRRPSRRRPPPAPAPARSVRPRRPRQQPGLPAATRPARASPASPGAGSSWCSRSLGRGHQQVGRTYQRGHQQRRPAGVRGRVAVPHDLRQQPAGNCGLHRVGGHEQHRTDAAVHVETRDGHVAGRPASRP